MKCLYRENNVILSYLYILVLIKGKFMNAQDHILTPEYSLVIQTIR